MLIYFLDIAVYLSKTGKEISSLQNQMRYNNLKLHITFEKRFCTTQEKEKMPALPEMNS